MESFNPFKNKKSKSESTNLGKISKIAKFATLGTGLIVGANNLEAQNVDQNKDSKVGPETEKNINIENEKTEEVNGGNIEEVVVYSKRKYVDELRKQQEKYLADMAKYKQDSVEWVQANQAYQDSLNSYNFGKKEREAFKPFIDSENTEENAFKFVDVATEYLENRDKLNKDIKPIRAIYYDESPTKTITTYDTRPKGFIYATGYEFKNPINIHIKPTKPDAFPKIKYDPKYEHIKMRSLWATILKQDPNAKIGTLYSLDPLFEKGFTLDEAMNFPQDIKDQFNIDYIYNQIHGKEKQKEDYKHSGWNYENPEK
jgi:hypothetical protein